MAVEKIYIPRSVTRTNNPSVTGLTNNLDLNAHIEEVLEDSQTQIDHLELADGTAAAPSLTNSGDEDTGMYFPAANTVGFTAGGTQKAAVDTNGLVTDVVSELTAAAGVTVDGVLIKDNTLSAWREQVLSGDALDTAGAITLTAAQSGSTILLDKIDGLVITLPAGALGIFYNFLVTSTVTSNNYTIQGADAAALFLGQTLFHDADTANEQNVFKPNGTSNYRLVMNGTTTGGYVGTVIKVVCYSGVRWFTEVLGTATGTIATPYTG